MLGFRSLGDDEEIDFECKVSDKGLEATLVQGVDGNDCHGSHRRPMSKKKFRRLRCYNCGEFANHIASKCTLGPQPKKCHNCKGEDHLIADCPQRRSDDSRSKSVSSDSSSTAAAPSSSSQSAVSAATTTTAATNTTTDAPKQNEKAA
ncbi:unnamed protein product [Notodromas monacha]|uniref:CCHC-type domain-containing protein n=1 Tax=Notodromas monacha TaxID=399045 RepID=A0A7R9BZA8_9CRUS|nr:unnamed protein product [Notodromas monacha]CAG0923311.1 unnamed protein product [Notodromas monacha]